MRMIEEVREKKKGPQECDPYVRISAWGARVFVSYGSAASNEALVFENGECFVRGRRFLLILNSFARRKNITIEVDPTGLRIGRYSMVVQGYSPTTTPPEDFQVSPVTDLRVLGTGASYRSE